LSRVPTLAGETNLGEDRFRSLVYASLGSTSYRLFADGFRGTYSWIRFVVSCGAAAAAIGVLLEDLWLSVAVGVWIGLWISALTYGLVSEFRI
jgi:hypothetical protein